MGRDRAVVDDAPAPRGLGFHQPHRGLGAEKNPGDVHLQHPAPLAFIIIFNALTDFGALFAIGIPLLRRQGIDRAAWTSAAFALPAVLGWLTVFSQLS